MLLAEFSKLRVALRSKEQLSRSVHSQEPYKKALKLKKNLKVLLSNKAEQHVIPPLPRLPYKFLHPLLLRPDELEEPDPFGLVIPKHFHLVLSDCWNKAVRSEHVHWNEQKIFQVRLTKYIENEEYSLLFIANTKALNRTVRAHVPEELVILDNFEPTGNFLLSLENYPLRPLQFKMTNKVDTWSENVPTLDLHCMYEYLLELAKSTFSVPNFDPKWYATYEGAFELIERKAWFKQLHFVTLPEYHEAFAEKILRAVPIPPEGQTSEVAWDEEFYLFHFAIRLPPKMGTKSLEVLEKAFRSLIFTAKLLVGLDLLESYRYDFCMTTGWMMYVPRKTLTRSRFLEYECFNSLGLFRCGRDIHLEYVSRQDWLSCQYATSYFWSPDLEENLQIEVEDGRFYEDSPLFSYLNPQLHRRTTMRLDRAPIAMITPVISNIESPS